MKGIKISKAINSINSKTTNSIKEKIKMKKTTKLGLLTAMVGVMVLVVSAPLIEAFHDADSLQCNKCHTMHYSEAGTSPPTTGFGPDGTSGADANGPFAHLLLKKNTTDLCLVCHSDPAEAPDVYNATPATPGGDFAPGGTVTDANGHNPTGVPTDNESTLILADGSLGITPPGGSMTGDFTCTTCHSAHGGSDAFAYRNLRTMVKTINVSGTIGSGDIEEATIWASGANVDAEAADNHNVYWNGDDTTGQANTRFGAWCGVCHGTFHGDESDTNKTVNADGDWTRHPTAYALGSTIAGYYTTTYDPAKAPLVSPQLDGWTTGTVNVSDNEEVFCLSCHKAHASANTNATRWPMGSAAGSGTSCNKCHAKGS